MSTIKWKPGRGKSWREKLEREHPSHGKLVAIPPRMQKNYGNGTLLIPKPVDVDALMRLAKRGKLITQSELRARLARDAGADHACPLTTGIFMRIAAETAEEDLRAGKKRITPYWRTIKDDGRLNEKFPGGAVAQAKRLRAEGVTIRPHRRGGRPTVADFERRLMCL